MYLGIDEKYETLSIYVNDVKMDGSSQNVLRVFNPFLGNDN